jgi:hypothetical protein
MTMLIHVYYIQEYRKQKITCGGEYPFTSWSLPINKYTHVHTDTVYSLMINCEHCDVEAYYRITIEDFNSVDSYNADLCIKCVRIEGLRAIRDLPATKSLRIEPLYSVLTPSIPST